MSEQLTFNLPFKTAFGRDDFFVSTSNAQASQVVETWQTWSHQALLLVGPSGSGKSHLAQIWAEDVEAKVVPSMSLPLLDFKTFGNSHLAVDDIDQIIHEPHAEQTLFHIINLYKSSEFSLLMTSGCPLSDLNFELPDLKSRIRATQLSTLNDPDDELFMAVMIKQFEDRQIAIDFDVIAYLQKRIDRSFAAVRDAVDRIDAAALRDRRKITKQYVSAVLNS